MDDLYVLARRVLLDALDALGAHRDAVIVVGAHAVYMRAEDVDLAVAPHTTDGDLNVIDARKSVEPMRRITIPSSVVPSFPESGRLGSCKCSHGSEGRVTAWT